MTHNFYYSSMATLVPLLYTLKDGNRKLGKHYKNSPMQYTAIFFDCENENCQLKIFYIFLIFAQNVDCGYTLEPPHRGGSNEYPQSMF